MSDPILIVKDLQKSYGSHPAVQGISFQVARGEIFGLLGPNGAGKTTTLAILTGLIRPNHGSITIGGLDLLAQARQARSRIGYVPQELALYPSLTARENLSFFGQIYGLRGRRLVTQVDKVLEMVQLTDRAKERVDTFSGGMKRRVNIAAGLLHEPEMLFLDEPTVGVDPQSRNAIFESIESLNHQGLSVIYTTHYMEEAQRLCHRVAILDHGTIIAMDTPSGLVHSLGEGLIRVGLLNGKADAVRGEIARLASVKSLAQQDGVLNVQAVRSQEALIGILDIVNRLDAHVTSLQILESNLETVFLSLTGKNLRD